MNNNDTFRSRLKHAWNAFFNRAPTESGYQYRDLGTSYSYRPDRPRFSRGSERTIINSIYNRIALDSASIEMFHVRLDDQDRYVATIDSHLNKCLSFSANIDQTGRAFRQDIVMSMLDEGCVAIVPTDTTINPKTSSAFDILTMRTGKIVDWYPKHVKVELYNENTGKKEQITLPKEIVAIVENPFYSVMNEHNSILQRVIKKLTILDAIDEHTGSGKLDLIIQLPYVIKGESRKKQAEERRQDIERQLSDGKYGVAYTDGTERVIQLNRPVENNLMTQIEYLVNLLYSQLGLTQAIMDGSANDAEMQNYYNRTIEPILSAIVEEMDRKFLSKTAITQHQRIKFFRSPFKLIPVSQLAELADKMTRNEIMTSNEIRQLMGMKPSDDPNADKLRNSNINHPESEEVPPEGYEDEYYDEGDFQNGL